MNLVILGPQGCGKGTQAKLLAEELELAHIEIGSALRAEAKQDTQLGRKIDEIVNQKRELVSDDIVAEVLRENIKNVSAEKGIIIDGAPRKISQIKEVEDAFSENNRKLDKVIFINLSEDESLKRLSIRSSCSECKKTLHIGKDIESIEEKCPSCGGLITQRKDDTPEGIKKRLEIFNQQTWPVIEHYKNKGILLEINGEQGVKGVFKDIINAIKENE